METEINEVTKKTCRACLVANLVEDVKIARCLQCRSLYCLHFASKIDPALCVECLAEISLHKEIVTKTYTRESYDEASDSIQTSTYSKKARQVKLDGLHWLFAQRAILAMSDNELELAVEYHREILTGMLAEREDRKAKFLHRYAQVKPGNESVRVDQATSTQMTVKKSRTISSTKASAVAAATLASMVNSGMDAASLLAMLQNMQTKVKP